jgi:hypothetical protein
MRSRSISPKFHSILVITSQLIRLIRGIRPLASQPIYSLFLPATTFLIAISFPHMAQYEANTTDPRVFIAYEINGFIE